MKTFGMINQSKIVSLVVTETNTILKLIEKTCGFLTTQQNF